MKNSLYIIRGPIGVGKTSVTQSLHQRIADRASLVEVDGIKRMLDPTTSSDWRRNIANSTAAFILDQLFEIPIAL